MLLPQYVQDLGRSRYLLGMTWNPDQYHKFRAAREQPALDLQAMIPDLPYRRVADLGCGTGEQTLALAQRFLGAAVTGIDASAEMLAQAQAHTAAHLSFRQSDLRELDGTYDLLYSNAALQWLPDHPALLAGLWERLNPGGVLAVQVPANHDHVSHRLITETADEFTHELGGYTRFGPVHGATPVLTPAAYAEVLDGLGARELEVISRVYPTELSGAEGVLEWVRGTALVPYLSRLNAEDAARFEDTYRQRLLSVFGDERVFYAFTRILFVAHKSPSL